MTTEAMPMKKQFVTALSIVLFALGGIAATAAHADESHSDDRSHRSHFGAGMHEGGDPERLVKHLTRKLDLDQTQQQHIENIVSAAKPEIDALRDRAEANRNAMDELDINDSNRDAQLNVLATEKGAIATEQALLHGRLKSEINAVLTPEQRQELAASAGKMRDRFHKRHEGRSGD
jgi:Spy/CpxP family protein refolding chaperone